MFSALRRWFTTRAGSQTQSTIPESGVPEQSAPDNQSGTPLTFNAEEEFLRILFRITATEQLPLTPWEKTMVQAIERTLAKQEQLTEQVPRLPAVIPQLMAAMRRDDVSGSQLAELIERDLTLTGEVLSLVNSPFFVIRRKEIQSLQEAVVILGQNGIREAIASAAFRPIMQFESHLFDRAFVTKLWEQSTKCASLCRCQAAILTLDPFEAFLAGLMRNIGLIVAIRIINRSDDGSARPKTRLFLAHLSNQISQLSAAVARGWGLPDAVIAVLQEQPAAQPPESLSEFGKILFISTTMAYIHTLIEEHDYPATTVDALFASDLPITRKSRDCYARMPSKQS